MQARFGNKVFMMILVVIYLLPNTSYVLSSFLINPGLVGLSKAAISTVTLDSDDVMEKASHILVGTVENIQSQQDEETNSIITYVEVNVEELLKGTIKDDYVVITHRGGELPDIGQLVSGEPHFSLHEKVKVFLNLEETGEFTVAGGWKGKISLVSPASSGFSYSGVHWDSADLPVPYYINENGTPDVLGTDQEFQAVQASFQTWEDDPESFMDYAYIGTTTRGNESLDGYNVVSWQSIDGSGGTLAQAIYWYNPSTQLMTEFDIVFDEDETWSANGEPGKHDIQNVGTHEVGHTLVLEDLYDLADSEQTMYGYSILGETKKRTLGAGDLAGIRYIYPVSKPVYTITTSPSGLLIEVDGANYTSPQSFEWTPNSTHTIYVPSTQSGGVNTRHAFISWSDGGAQKHQITVGAYSVTITASYLTQYSVTIETQGLELTYPATVNFIQLGTFKVASTSDSWSDWCDSDSVLTIASFVEGEEGERWSTYNLTSWRVYSSLTATVNYVLQYRVSMTFKTYDQMMTLQPILVQILGASPNNTLVTLRSYDGIWLDNVSWTLKQVFWQNSNVVALDSLSVNLAPDYEWTIISRVYQISFDATFKDFKGSELSENPSSFTLQFPNGTISGELNPSAVYYIQNGTTQWKSIVWQSVEVAPQDASFDATEGNPTVNCLIYDFEILVSDLLGLPVAGAQVSVELSNGRAVNTQTGPDGVALIRMAPQGEFSASVSYLGQTVSVYGDAAEVALESVRVKIAFGLFTLVFLFMSLVFVGALAVILVLRKVKSQSVMVETA